MPELFAVLNLPTPTTKRRKLSGRMGLTMALGNPKMSLEGKHLHCGPIRKHSSVLRGKTWVARDARGIIAIQCMDLPLMVNFYTSVLGLERVCGCVKSGVVTLKNPVGFCGHAAMVKLHSNPNPRQQKNSTCLAHLTLSLSYMEQEKALDWFDHLEYPYKIECLNWVGWYGVSLIDPEGNTAELVSLGPSF